MIERLAKAKYQDNLEFAQWMKRYYDVNGGANKDYDPVAHRGNARVDFTFGNKPVVASGQTPKIESSKAAMLYIRHGDTKDKDIFKSLSPIRKMEAKSRLNIGNVGVGKKSNLIRTKDRAADNDDDVENLYSYLMRLKGLLEGDEKDKEKRLGEMGQLVEKGLNLKMFEGQRKEIKVHNVVIDSKVGFEGG